MLCRLLIKFQENCLGCAKFLKCRTNSKTLVKCKTVIDGEKVILTKVFYDLEVTCAIFEQKYKLPCDDFVDGLFVSNKSSRDMIIS